MVSIRINNLGGKIQRTDVITVDTEYAIELDKVNNISTIKGENKNLTQDELLCRIKDNLQSVIENLQQNIENLRTKHVTREVESVVNCSDKVVKSNSFYSIMEYRINELKTKRKITTMDNYKSTLRALKLFRNEDDIIPSMITPSFVKQFEVHLKEREVCPNTISFYMRIFRAVYNYAFENEFILENKMPFKRVFTGEAKTRKRAVDIHIVRKLVKLDLTSYPRLDISRDMFLFSVLTRGMAFVDVAHLTRKNIHNNEIIYNRHKTGQRIRIELLPCMKEIIDKYIQQTGENDYLFPLLTPNQRKEIIAYTSALRMHNKHLSEISEMLRLKSKLSSYVARHTWATIAKNKGVSVSVICDAMGHTSEETTRIYLDSLDKEMIDKANYSIVSSIFNVKALNNNKK